MLATHEADAVYRTHAQFIRRYTKTHYGKRLQAADIEDVIQTVALNVVRGWPSPPPRNPEAWLTTTIQHVVAERHRNSTMQKRDVRRSEPLIEEGDSGPINGGLVADDDVPADFERFRTKKRVRLIAAQLPQKELMIFHRMLRDWDAVPSKDRRRVVAALRDLLRIDETNEEAGLIVEGPSHCGRTTRRLDLDEDEAA